ncbi:unnamed protein product [Anisakis simplex]|uniref:Glutathione peroxidase n=1 Tax=Anisakis simplex TaxID=6269 RepID=A0A0M3JWL2_ANISI|nr:unnamed protein product [Anisakis simplex]
MKYCNSLLLLRTLTLILSVLLLKDYHLLIKTLPYLWIPTQHEFTTSQTSVKPSKLSLNWDEVNLLSPPFLNDSVLESLRLNELLANPQYKCQKPIRIGNDQNSFVVCHDDMADARSAVGFSDALLLSGYVSEDGSLMKSLNAKRWTVFVPENYSPLDQLGNVDVEVNYLMRLRDFEDWDVDNILDGIENKHFDSAFLNFYSSFISKPENGGFDQLIEAPKFVEKLLPYLHTKQMQIVVKIDKKNAENVIFEWYRLLYRVFFKYNFALIDAQFRGVCLRRIDGCVYRLSFIHNSQHNVSPPVFGLGSPIEERKRLIQFMKTVDRHHNCTLVTNEEDAIPPFCKPSNSREACVIVYISYRKPQSARILHSLDSCEVFFFSPLQSNLIDNVSLMKNLSNNCVDYCLFISSFVLAKKMRDSVDFRNDSRMHVFNFGISPHINESISVSGVDGGNQWELLKFSDVIEKCGQKEISTLILDLNGGEWSVLEAILNSSEQLKRISQISMRIRWGFLNDASNILLILPVSCASVISASAVLAIIVLAIDFTAPVYQFTMLDADGKEVSLDKYRGKVLMIVNVASQCGLTNSNYHQMKVLLNKYKAKGFEIAAFPCNQFAGQEPDSEAQIKKFVRETFDFEPDLYSKINVNGADEHPLYTYLKNAQHGTFIDAIKWNFTKFLVNKSGYVIQRYAPTTEPLSIEEDINKLLNDRSDL